MTRQLDGWRSGLVVPDFADVLRSNLFQFGYYRNGRDIIRIDPERRDHRCNDAISADERAAIAARTGHDPGAMRIVDYGAFDATRATAEFVVVKAGFSGGGVAMFNDRYSDSWGVTAKRLRSNGLYDANGEQIYFYVEGTGDCGGIPVMSIEVTRRMQQIFVPE